DVGERAGDVGRCSEVLDAAVEHDRGGVRDLEDLVRELLDDDRRDTAPSDVGHDLVELLDDNWCQAHRELVERQHPRLGGGGAGRGGRGGGGGGRGSMCCAPPDKVPAV